MLTHERIQWNWREGKKVGGCSGPDYGDWMMRKDEYLNEQINLLAVVKWGTAGQGLPAVAGGCLRWEVMGGNKSWTGLKDMKKGGNNGLTHECKLDNIRGGNG